MSRAFKQRVGPIILLLSSCAWMAPGPAQPNSASAETSAARPPLNASQPQSQPAPPAGEVSTGALRVTTRLVLVDAVVTDSNGKPLTGLIVDDFELREDGKKQVIKGLLEASSLPRTSAPAPSLAPGTYTNVSRFRPDSGPPVIVLIDELNTAFTDQAYAREQLSAYLSALGPRRNVAIYLLGRRLRLVHDFTADPESIQQAIANHPGESLSIPGIDSNLKPSDLQTGNVPDRAPPLSPTLAQTVAAAEATTGDFDARLKMRITLDALRSLARQAAGIPGRKILIWLTAGSPFSSFESVSQTPFHDDFQHAGKLLTDARVAIYPVDARGLVAFHPAEMAAGMAGLVNTQLGMNDIAGWTGGRAFFGRNDLDRAMAEAVDEGSSYYVLEYYPTNKNWNGEFRSIQVKVLRKNLQVRCRKGYFATDWAQPTPSQTKAAIHEFADALSSDSLGATGLPFTAQVVPPGTNHRQVWVDVGVDPRSVVFEQQTDHLHHAKVEFVTVVQDAKGKKVLVKVDVLNTNLTTETFAKVMASSLAVREKFDLAAGKYVLIIGVRDMKSNLIGSLTAPVEVPALSEIPNRR